MKSILIIGAGFFSVEVEELARIQGLTDIAFLDDKVPSAIGTHAGYWKDAGSV